MKWYVKVLRQYADFDGRARRREFWLFELVNIGIAVGLVFLAVLLGLAFGVGSDSPRTAGLVTYRIALGALILYLMVVFLPTLAVQVRRLQDTNRSGAWVLLHLVPFGGIALLVLLALPGSRGPNRYGPDPKAAPASYGGYPGPVYGYYPASPQPGYAYGNLRN